MNEELIAAAREFVERCERGEIRSTHSYARFKAALASPQPKTTTMNDLTDEQLDALDTFSLAWGAPRGHGSVRAYGRAVIAALAAQQPKKNHHE